MIRILITIIFLFHGFLISAQTDSLSQTNKILVGLDIVAPFSPYSGVAMDIGYFISPRDHIYTKLKYITDETPLTRGFEVSLKYNRFNPNNYFYLTSGIMYHQSNMTEDVILDRLDGTFFQEIDLVQNRKLLAVTFGFGFLIKTTDYISLRIEPFLLVGQEIFDKHDGPAASFFVENQYIDNRFVYNPDMKLIRQKIGGHINFSCNYHF